MKGVPSASSWRMTGSATVAGDEVDELLLAAEARASSHGSGEYAPMPPVLGPSSPSRRRLKSWAGLSGSTWSPSLRKKSDTSGPARNSSTSTRPDAAGSASRVRERGVAVVGDDDALARGEAVGLDDVRGAELVERGLDLGAGRGAQRRGRSARPRHP